MITTASTDFKYFTGELVHSQYYRCPDRFTGKRVLIIGAGESGSDITNEISKVASKCAIAVRGLHGHLIPRIQGILASCRSSATVPNTTHIPPAVSSTTTSSRKHHINSEVN
jgi:cation diffusion facilitator CzcD-associated flavoprotein CzcO